MHAFARFTSSGWNRTAVILNVRFAKTDRNMLLRLVPSNGRWRRFEMSIMNVETATALIAKVEAVEKAGIPMTEENTQKLGYVETEGGI
jgi:hypothetical protein